jgi:hypothetical protein
MYGRENYRKFCRGVQALVPQKWNADAILNRILTSVGNKIGGNLPKSQTVNL